MLQQTNLLAAFRFTLDYAEKLVADVPDPRLAELPHPGMNHGAWVLGHVALGSDFVGLLVGPGLETDETWMKTFGPGSVPVAVRSNYPAKDELLAVNRRLHARAVSLVESATADRLAAPNETPFFPQQFPSVGDLLTHLLTTHATLHLGQLSAWRRVLGYGAVLGV